MGLPAGKPAKPRNEPKRHDRLISFADAERDTPLPPEVEEKPPA